MPKEKSRKPRRLPGSYNRSTKTRKPKGAPATSAVTKPKHASKNLTLNDWLTVIAFCDANPNMTQEEVVEHFAKLPMGALKFTQSTLSRHLSKEGRETDQGKLLQNANALSACRARVVTRPDVERCLVIWCSHMEEKGELVNGPMLLYKRAKIEELLDIPIEQRLKSTGWISKFCRAYVLNC